MTSSTRSPAGPSSAAFAVAALAAAAAAVLVAASAGAVAPADPAPVPALVRVVGRPLCAAPPAPALGPSPAPPLGLRLRRPVHVHQAVPEASRSGQEALAAPLLLLL